MLAAEGFLDAAMRAQAAALVLAASVTMGESRGWVWGLTRGWGGGSWRLTWLAHLLAFSSQGRKRLVTLLFS